MDFEYSGVCLCVCVCVLISKGQAAQNLRVITELLSSLEVKFPGAVISRVMCGSRHET